MMLFNKNNRKFAVLFLIAMFFVLDASAVNKGSKSHTPESSRAPAADGAGVSLTQCYSKVIVSPNNVMGPDRFTLPGALSSKPIGGGRKEVLVLSASDLDEQSARQSAESLNSKLKDESRVQDVIALGCANTVLTNK